MSETAILIFVLFLSRIPGSLVMWILSGKQAILSDRLRQIMEAESLEPEDAPLNSRWNNSNNALDARAFPHKTGIPGLHHHWFREFLRFKLDEKFPEIVQLFLRREKYVTHAIVGDYILGIAAIVYVVARLFK